MNALSSPSRVNLAQEHREALAEYDLFLGKPYSKTVYDWTLRCYVRCTMQQPKTPKDAVGVSDQIADEALKNDFQPAYTPQSKTALFQSEINRLLAERPMNTRQLADATGETINRVKGLIRNHPHNFVVLGHGLNGHIYGLKDKQYDTPIYHIGMGRIVDYLRQHGPSTVPQLCTDLVIYRQYFNHARKLNPGILHITGRTTIETSKKPVQIWGIVGIHEGEGSVYE